MNNKSTTISNLFIKDALRTESPITPDLIDRISDPRTIRLLHAAMGLVTEAGEIMDALKKHIFYGKDLDLVNIKEEIGDSQWYTAIALDEIGNTYEEIWAMVIKKLQVRYKNKDFSMLNAIYRDLDSERKTIEDGLLVHLKTGICKVLCQYEGDCIFTEELADITCKNCLALLPTTVISTTHWLNVETSNSLCKNFKVGDKTVLTRDLVTCNACSDILDKVNDTEFSNREIERD